MAIPFWRGFPFHLFIVSSNQAPPMKYHYRQIGFLPGQERNKQNKRFVRIFQVNNPTQREETLTLAELGAEGKVLLTTSCIRCALTLMLIQLNMIDGIFLLTLADGSCFNHKLGGVIDQGTFRGLLLVVSHLFVVPISILWLGLEKKNYNLNVRNVFAARDILSTHN